MAASAPARLVYNTEDQRYYLSEGDAPQTDAPCRYSM